MISERTLEVVKNLSGALLDAYVLVDRKQRIMEFNQVFFGLFPRSVGRGLKKKALNKVLEFQLAGEAVDLVEQCMAKEKPVRYDEIIGVLGPDSTCKLVASAVPLLDDNQEVAGAFLCVRDITDEAQAQVKYRQMLEQDSQERELLQQRVQEAEAELIQAKDRVNGLEKELLDYKKGLLI